MLKLLVYLSIFPEGFAFVGMSDRSIKAKGRKLFILESGEFQLHGDATLSFDLYRRSNAISLQVLWGECFSKSSTSGHFIL